MNELKIEYIPKESLKAYRNNAKIHTAEQVDQIKKSIEEVGFNDPIAVWHDNEIIEGHGRLLAVMEMDEIQEVPIIRLDELTDEQRKAYMLIHNKLTMNTDFDDELLDIELDNITDIDMSLFGFDFDDEDEPQEIIEDSIPEEVETLCKQGDLWILGKHRLACGDSTRIQDVEMLMGEQKADMVFTDPPWNVNYGAVEEGNAQGYKPRTILNDFMGTEQFREFMHSSFQCMNEVSKNGACTYVVMSAQEWGNMMLTLAQNDYHWSSTIIWNKDRLVLSRKDYHTKYEPIWYGWKEGTRLHPLKDRKQCDVWDFDRPSKSEEHPTMKPVELVAKAVHNSSDKGNIVLDLFGGSGTTLIACEQLERQCYMQELDPHYCDVIVQRYINFKGDADNVVLIRDGKEIPYGDIK